MKNIANESGQKPESPRAVTVTSPFPASKPIPIPKSSVDCKQQGRTRTHGFYSIHDHGNLAAQNKNVISDDSDLEQDPDGNNELFMIFPMDDIDDKSIASEARSLSFG